jgi:hypothetical protein
MMTYLVVKKEVMERERKREAGGKYLCILHFIFVGRGLRVCELKAEKTKIQEKRRLLCIFCGPLMLSTLSRAFM